MEYDFISTETCVQCIFKSGSNNNFQNGTFMLLIRTGFQSQAKVSPNGFFFLVCVILSSYFTDPVRGSGRVVK